MRASSVPQPLTSKPLTLYLASLILLIQAVVLIAVSFKLPLYQVRRAIQRGGEYVYSPRVRITRILPSTIADRNDLHENDIIVSINGTPIQQTLTVTELVNVSQTGQPVTLTIERNGKVRLVSLIPEYDPKTNRKLLGIELSNTEFKKVPLLLLIPKTILGTYLGIFDLLPSLRSGLLSFIGLLLGLFYLIMSLGLFKRKMWGLVFFLIMALTYIFTFILAVRELLTKGFSIFLDSRTFIPYSNAIFFVTFSIYFLFHTSWFRKPKSINKK